MSNKGSFVETYIDFTNSCVIDTQDDVLRKKW